MRATGSTKSNAVTKYRRVHLGSTICSTDPEFAGDLVAGDPPAIMQQILDRIESYFEKAGPGVNNAKKATSIFPDSSTKRLIIIGHLSNT